VNITRAGAPGDVTVRYQVLTPGRIPTTDYYFGTRAAAMPAGSVEWIDTLAERAAVSRLAAGSCAIVVRYAPSAWLEALRAWRGRVVLFMDDDLRAAWRAPELPRRYALRTSWRFARTARALSGLGAQSWVSTAELASRYAQWQPRVVPPLYLEGVEDGAAPSPLGYCYHGTWAHRREIEWLVPVVREVQRRLPAARFEVLGGARVARMYRGIPGVSVRASLPWPQYRALAGTRYQLGLAPCLDSAFNRARSHVKLFDITRLGAAGIYSRLEPYAHHVEDGVTGWLCANDPEAWVDAICRALGDAPRCSALRARALAACRAARDAAGGFE
jgi:hypothetical protein